GLATLSAPVRHPAGSNRHQSGIAVPGWLTISTTASKPSTLVAPGGATRDPISIGSDPPAVGHENVAVVVPAPARQSDQPRSSPWASSSSVGVAEGSPSHRAPLSAELPDDAS